MDPAASEVRRDKTAIRRFRCSRPIALALAEGLLRSESTVLDYGCGHGADVRFLNSRGIRAGGWDPFHAPDGGRSPAAVVNLGYVLNVIEDPAERRETLRRAFDLAEEVLVVSVRVDRSLEDAAEFSDGVITEKSTFQKIFSQSEFQGYVEGELSRRMHTAAQGVGFVFKSEEAEQRFVASKAFTRRLEYRTDLIETFAKDPVAKRFVKLANSLGRAPLPDEFDGFAELADRFGSAERIQRLLLAKIDKEAYAGSQVERRNDILLYLAMLKLQGIKPPPVRSLPAPVQADVKALWGGFDKAQRDGLEFLYSLGAPEAVKMACQASTVGKLLPGDLYVHRSAEDELPALLRVVLFAARRIVGELSYDLAKFALDGRAVAFLAYPGFEEVAHPGLKRSVRVYLPKAAFEVRDYHDSSNPPILHRKDALVSRTYSKYSEFRALTEQEEELGLLSSNDIGFKKGWEALLASRRLFIDGHRISTSPVMSGR